MWCAADCVKVTAGADNLSAHFCAGCDGNLYPLTGHVFLRMTIQSGFPHY
uniref:IncF plasmid conjugative transfer pilus assembly protein TraU n=1 Tax=Klebsiella pneumoniae TaxID=573 RepID=A0A8B0ST29_KLEPN|nr:IncF plasmid conjugative transfer pilus assembly protein TraU [Klebsiella pneumoniae]